MEQSSSRLQAARSNEKYPPQPASHNFKQHPALGLSNRRTGSTHDLSGKQQHPGVKYAPSTSTNHFNGSRGGGTHQQQSNQKALLTTQLNFPSSKQQMYQAKRALNSGYSSRNATQQDVVPRNANLSNKVPSHAGDNQRSNDYLRLKRVNNNVMKNMLNDSTG